MSYERTSAAEIDRKLREDFRRRLKDYGQTAEINDPVLAVLFRSVATRMERQYADTDRMRLALLEELTAGLGLAHRAARPAQTVVRFHGGGSTSLIAAGTELVGDTASGERITFSTDVPLAISNARLAFCCFYRSGQLRLAGGLDMSEEAAAAGPSMVATPADLGPDPCLFLAIEDLDDSHLSRHGIFIETSPYALDLREALLSEPWCLARADGTFAGDGLLRPQRANAGVRELRWLLHGTLHGTAEAAGREMPVPALPDGFYGPRTFLFPSIPPGLRCACGTPRGMDAVLPKLFRKPSNLFSKPRAWIRISLPPELADFERGISNIMLHAVSASNVECLNQTVHFETDGVSIPVSREAGTGRFLVAPLSVMGESGSEYLAELSPSASETAGRYTIRNGRMLLRPSRWGEEQADRYANVRLWITDGAAANAVGPGQVKTFLRGTAGPQLRAFNPTAAAGGWDSEVYADAHARLAHALLSRDRLVTRADLLGAVRAFDRRIQSVDLSFELRRTLQGLQRVHLVSTRVRRDQFVDYPQESRLLREELATFLLERSLFDVPVVVDVVEAA
jgi:hypothetical protein